jgi:hypothetical protein
LFDPSIFYGKVVTVSESVTMSERRRSPIGEQQGSTADEQSSDMSALSNSELPSIHEPLTLPQMSSLLASLVPSDDADDESDSARSDASS